jgi:brefeldin A-inhibited guanine nucleotide-exchange protein
MHAYVDLMDFRSLGFLASLRIFLRDFLLPGEAQKLDRFMLKFAAKFLNDNPGIFKDAGKRDFPDLA